MNDQQIILDVAKAIGVSISPGEHSDSKLMLVDKINELINSDFQKLISILYRVDINESKLKKLLRDNPNTDAGLIIADLVIERQVQKIKSRQDHRRDSTISDEDSW